MPAKQPPSERVEIVSFGVFSEELEKATRHEVGHAVVALALKREPAGMWVQHSWGAVESSGVAYDTTALETAQLDIAVSFAGYIAERRGLHWSRARSLAGARDDFDGIELWNPLSSEWPSPFSASVRRTALLRTLDANANKERAERAWRSEIVLRSFWIARRIIVLAADAIDALSDHLQTLAERADDGRAAIDGTELRSFARAFKLRGIGTRAAKEWQRRARRLRARASVQSSA